MCATFCNNVGLSFLGDCREKWNNQNLVMTMWRTAARGWSPVTAVRPWGGTIDLWALRFLVVKEIDCGDWLAREYMPAHQHCDLFYPLVGDLIGSAINYCGRRKSAFLQLATVEFCSKSQFDRFADTASRKKQCKTCPDLVVTMWRVAARG